MCDDLQYYSCDQKEKTYPSANDVDMVKCNASRVFLVTGKDNMTMTFHTKRHAPAEEDQYTAKANEEANYIKYAGVIIRRHHASLPRSVS